MAGIYIHVPFCRQACSYCDFYFVTKLSIIPEYVDSLCREIELWRDSKWTASPIKTLYFGGGTPSVLSLADLSRIYEMLASVFDISALDEFTLELNPEDARPEYLQGLRSIGVHRLSMGVQTFDPKLLAWMHRNHDAAQSVKSLENIRNAGFDHFNADLIYGNPGQSDEALSEDISRLLHFDPPHVSAYALTIEESTRLGKLEALGRLEPAPDDDVARQALLVQERLTDAGLQRYEVSNYSKKGAEALHNTNYWRHIPYLGLGPGAHSFWFDNQEAWRWSNARDLRAWMKDPEGARSAPEKLTALQLAEEYVLLRLRTDEGLEPENLNKVYHYTLQPQQWAYWNRLVDAGLAHPGETWRLTPNGLNVADRITVDLLSIENEADREPLF